MPAVRRVVSAGVLTIILGLTNAGCGSGTRAEHTSGPAATRSADRLRLPPVRMLDVGSGRQVDLARYQPHGKPVLVWAWAPYCPYCRREAPAVEQFARKHSGQVQVIGVGTQNTAAEARTFRRQTGTTSFPMLYEADGFLSWKPFGFVAQPAAALLSADGRVLRTWSGPFDEAEALRLIAT